MPNEKGFDVYLFGLFNIFIVLWLMAWSFLSIGASLGFSQIISTSSPTVVNSPLGSLGVGFLTIIYNLSTVILFALIAIAIVFGNMYIFRYEIAETTVKIQRWWRRYNHQKEYRSGEDL